MEAGLEGALAQPNSTAPRDFEAKMAKSARVFHSSPGRSWGFAKWSDRPANFNFTCEFMALSTFDWSGHGLTMYQPGTSTKSSGNIVGYRAT
jgi:hypothetical protein